MALTETVGGIIDVNITQQTGIQFQPSIAALANGGFVVSWTDNQTGNVIARLFDEEGFGDGADFRVTADVGNTTNPNFSSDVAVLSDGSIEFAWTSQFDPNDLDVRGRRFNEDGTPINSGNQALGTTSARDEFSPAITGTADGRYLVSWTEDDGRLGFVQKDIAGNTLSSGDATPGGNGTEGHSSVATLRDGSIALVYEAGGNIFERRMVAGDNGVVVNGASAVAHSHPTVAALENGGYVVAWQEGDSPNKFIDLQRYDALGNKVGDAFVATAVAGQIDQTTPVVKGLVGGGFIVVWDDGQQGVRAIAFDDNGLKIGDTLQITPVGSAGAFGDLDVVQKKDGDIVITFSGSDNDGAGIDAQIVRVYNQVVGTSGSDRLVTELEGGVSRLRAGFQANDSIQGLGGDDVMQGSGGRSDILDGGSGRDTATYIDAPSRVDANLSVPAFNLGEAIGDTYISIENLEGSFFGDGLTGNSAANQLDGVDGNDFLDGRGGNDTLIGNFGRDEMTGGTGDDLFFVDVAGAMGDTIIEGANEGAADIVAAKVSYTLASGVHVENLRTTSTAGTTAIALAGNQYSQTIIGNAGANTLNGREGHDTLTGLGGADAFVFDRALSSSNYDHITDFTHGVDKVRLDKTIFTTLPTGALAASAFKDISTGTEDANDRVLYNRDNGGLYYDADGAGGAAAKLVAILDNHAALSASDFLVIA